MIVAALAALCAGGPAAAEACLSYGRDTSLSGRVYAFEAFEEGVEDIARARRHDYYALILKQPVCVGARDDPRRPFEQSVGIIELRLPPERLEGLLGREVAVSGALAHALSDGEPTAIYMRVRRLQPQAAAK